jgi:hypothetical protein
MKNMIFNDRSNAREISYTDLINTEIPGYNITSRESRINKKTSDSDNSLPEILFITSYPPSKSSIAKYAYNLIESLVDKSGNPLSIKVCALETGESGYQYPDEVRYTLDTTSAEEYEKLAKAINEDNRISIVVIQHEFGFFREQETAFFYFIYALSKPVVIAFHSVLPRPGNKLKSFIRNITDFCESVLVMSHSPASILINDYGLTEQKISVIAHNNHLVPYSGESSLAESGCALDDNSFSMIASCVRFSETYDIESLETIKRCLGFLKERILPSGRFVNSKIIKSRAYDPDSIADLDDSNGRVVWSLGYLTSFIDILPNDIILKARSVLRKSLIHIETVNSSRAIAFAIKGLYYYYTVYKNPRNLDLLKTLANRLVKIYPKEPDKEEEWFGGSHKCFNSILPEAMLYSWLLTKEHIYKEIAISSFNILLHSAVNEEGIKVLQDRSWFQNDYNEGHLGESSFDAVCIVMTLSKFYDVLGDKEYGEKMETALSWFAGENHLHRNINNPDTKPTINYLMSIIKSGQSI